MRRWRTCGDWLRCRLANEKVVLTVPPGDKPQRIVIWPVRVGQGRVRLAFDCKREVDVVREELAGADAEQHRRETLGRKDEA